MEYGSPAAAAQSERFDRRKCLKLYDSAIEADSRGKLEEALMLAFGGVTPQHFGHGRRGPVGRIMVVAQNEG